MDAVLSEGTRTIAIPRYLIIDMKIQIDRDNVLAVASPLDGNLQSLFA